MKVSITPEKILRQAYEYANKKIFINKNKENELCEQLNLITGQENIPLLLPIVFSNNKKLSQTAAGVIHQIFSKIPIEKLELLDEKIRTTYQYNCLSCWCVVKFNMIEELNVEPAIKNSLYALYCSHGNGYIREQAINQLLPDFPELNIAILLIRVNDWVAVIQQLAIEKLIAIINANKIAEFIPSLYLIEQLEQKTRHDHAYLLQLIENKLTEKCYDKLLDAVLVPDLKLSRAAFNIAATERSKINYLLQAAYKTNDVVIKLKALRLAKESLSIDALFALITNKLSDKSAIIRSQCIYILFEKFPDRANPFLLEALFDRAFQLRELARFYLRANGVNQFIDVYQQALVNKTQSLSIAIKGLAEVGKQDDFKLIEPYLTNQQVSIKKACIYAIFKLKPANKQNLLLDQLSSGELAVFKAVALGVSQNPEAFAIDAMEKLFLVENDVYKEKLFVEMKSKVLVDQWQLIDFLLERLIKAIDENLMLLIETKIKVWLIKNSPTRIFTRPSADTLNSIMRKLDALMISNHHDSLFDELKNRLAQL